MKKIGYIMSLLIGILLGVWGMARVCEKALTKESRRGDKYTFLFKKCCNWIKCYQNNKNIKEYFDKHNISEVAIYGMGEVGACFYNAVREAGVSIKYVVDRDNRKWSDKCDLYAPEDDLPGVELLVVTAMYDFEEIKNNLKDRIQTNIVSLAEVIDEL